MALVVKSLPANAGDIRDVGLIPGLGRFPWRRAWQPTPVFLPGESPRTEEPGKLQSIGSQSQTWLNDSTYECFLMAAGKISCSSFMLQVLF